jgi:uncharacterized membrane protein YdjX (TVP38/TMEM64 family)
VITGVYTALGYLVGEMISPVYIGVEGTLAAVKKAGMVISYAALAAITIAYRDDWLYWIQNVEGPSLSYMVLLATLMALIPVIPFGIISGLLGVKYGVLLGGIVSVASSTAAAVLMFLWVRYTFKKQGRQYLSRFRQVERFTSLYEQYPFVSILLARLIPVIPAPAVNIYSAVSKVPLIIFISATLFGKMPVLFLFALMGEELVSTPLNSLFIGLVYAVFLGLVLWLHKLWRNRSAK